MNNVEFIMFTYNTNTRRMSSKRFGSEPEAIDYAKKQMRRKLGKDYKSIVSPFKGMLNRGYFDKDYNFEFYIVKRTKVDDIKTIYEPVEFELL